MATITASSSAFISLNDAINNFIISYTGPGKLIPDSKRTEVVFHARRCLQEFAYETLKSQFYVYGTNPPFSAGEAIIVEVPKNLVTVSELRLYQRIQGTEQPSVVVREVDQREIGSLGGWGTTEHVYVRDYETGYFYFPQAFYPGGWYMDYLSNSLTTNEDAQIPKLAEEALYACMVYAILANRENTNPNLLQRLLIEKIDRLEKSKSRLVFTNFSE